MKRIAISLLLLLATAQAQISLNPAQKAELESLLTKLQGYPALIAAQAQLEIAAANLAAAYDPVAVDLTAGYLDFESVEGPATFPEDALNLSADVMFRPIAFGDIADLLESRKFDLQLAELEFRQTVSDLQVQALTSALRAALAQDAVALSEQGAQLADEVFRITETRFERGAASESELREAAQGLRDARIAFEDAEADFELARLALLDLVGEVILPDIPEIPPVEGASPDVVRAEVNVARARIGLRSAERNLYPVANAGVNLYAGDKSTFSLGLESRTLQPKLGYDYSSTGSSPPRVSYSIGAGLSISAATFAQIEAAKRQLAAAEAALTLTRDNDAFQRRNLATQLTKAERALASAQSAYENARLSLAETRTREALGLSSPLDVRRAELQLAQADLALQQAELSVLERSLATYSYFGIPLSEVVQ